MMKSQSAFHSIRMLCQVLKVSSSAYYAWLKKSPGKRAQENVCLAEDIQMLFKASRATYGVPRLQKMLQQSGKYHGKSRIGRLMKQQGLKPKAARRFKATTNSRHDKTIADNVLGRQFRPVARHVAWASDITYVPTSEGWLYLATVIDLYNRKIVGWSMGTRLLTQLIEDALTMAVNREKPPVGVIHHSDRGSQYCSEAYQNLLMQHDFVCSMSRSGNCYDNAVMESFYHTLKIELIYGEKYRNRMDTQIAIFDYIEVFYNRQRLHSTLGYQTPLEFQCAA